MTVLRIAADLGAPVIAIVLLTYLIMLGTSAVVAVFAAAPARRRDALRVLMALLRYENP